MSETVNEFLIQTIDEYVKVAQASFEGRIASWDMDIFEKEQNEVVGGLLARQLSLALGSGINPAAWNPHILPIILRCMADVYITFCWIAKDPKPRARMFIEYGLGQEKLAIEKYRALLSTESEPDPDAVTSVELRERALDGERYRFLIPVNLGAWSEMDMRKMAIEVGEKAFYDLVYTQFSASVHSTWQHIWRFNLVDCNNPLPMGHRVPVVPSFAPDPHFFLNSAKYLCMTFAKFDAAFLAPDAERQPYQAHELLVNRFTKYFASQPQDAE